MIATEPSAASAASLERADIASGSKPLFWASKRGFDLLFSIASLPIVAGLAVILLVVNPLLNPGPVFFTQDRMGRESRLFRILKFRTMRVSDAIERGADDPVEVDRITPLGKLLRRLRIDELPQVVNILRGEMSLIGPRPDYADYAAIYSATIPGYRYRHEVRPGISGHAQVEMGYAEGLDLVRRKTELDLFYVAHAGWKLDVRILVRTVLVVLSGFGAR